MSVAILAEKPSVATDLARVLGKLPELGKFERKKDYFECDTGYISSAVGHLVELKMPEGPNGKKLPWGMKHLPVIPERFELRLPSISEHGRHIRSAAAIYRLEFPALLAKTRIQNTMKCPAELSVVRPHLPLAGEVPTSAGQSG